MTMFGDYSAYYDLLYRDKDHDGEVSYIDSLIRKYGCGARTILDLGCGSGKHALLLAEKGYEITGVDRSDGMLSVARLRLAEGKPEATSPRFLQGDIRTVRLGNAYDVVISLFHVFSYQAGNEDLRAALATVRTHLNPGGIFIFDCWYGPAVLSERPAVRIKRLEDEAVELTRIAEPVMHPNENLVAVNYQLYVRDKANNAVDVVRETHLMRYLFKPELELLTAEAGLALLDASEWLSGNPLGAGTWNACFVVKGK